MRRVERFTLNRSFPAFALTGVGFLKTCENEQKTQKKEIPLLDRGCPEDGVVDGQPCEKTQRLGVFSTFSIDHPCPLLSRRGTHSAALVQKTYPCERLRGDRRLLPGNGGVSVGTNLTIAQGDHKDRPYPRFLLYQGRRLRGGLRMTWLLHSHYKEPVLENPRL